MCIIKAKDPLSTTPEDLAGLIERSRGGMLAVSHPLGFDHLELTPLFDLPRGQRVRLHVWTGRALDDDLGSLHSHTWHLESLVLQGTIIDTIFLPEEDPRGEYIGSRLVYGDNNVARPAGRFRLISKGIRTVSAGSRYRIPAGAVHNSEAAEFPLVTLVHSVDDPSEVEQGPLVLSRGVKAGSATPVRPALSSDRFEEVLRMVRSISI